MSDASGTVHTARYDAVDRATPRPAGDGASRIFLRPIATPLPIGMLALAVGSVVLAGLQLRWVPVTQSHLIGLGLLGFVVPLQLVSFVFGYLSRDEGTASALATLSGTWFAIALVTLASAPGSSSGGLGLLLIAAAGALLVSVAVTATAKPLISLVLLLTAARFVTSGLYQLGVGPDWRTASGVLGVVVTGLAWYAAAAFALESSSRKAVLPVFRVRGDSSPDPSSGNDPIGPVTHDAAVRYQL